MVAFYSLMVYEWIDRSGRCLERISHIENGFDLVVWLEVPV